jgi:hypothetical protein
MRSALHSLPRNVFDRFVLHRRRNAQLHRRRITQLFQNENGAFRCPQSSRPFSIRFNNDSFLFDSVQIAHVIREIRMLQQTPYKIDMSAKVVNYLLDTTQHKGDDELYQISLFLEPRLSRLSTKVTSTAGTSGAYGGSSSATGYSSNV